jgi:hypothetical protein
MHTLLPRIPLVALVGLSLWVSSLSIAYSQQQAVENSTDKNRAVPNELASKVGSAIRWESDYSAALAKAKQSGKPIFWYVPSIPGTFMDRKEEVDRYMLAGPFSWPTIINLINQNCVPLRTIPNRALQKQFELQVYKFVEPGFLIVQPTEEVTLLANRLSTLHPPLIMELLQKALGPNSDLGDEASEFRGSVSSKALNEAIAANWQLEAEPLKQILMSDSMESKLVAGMCVFKMGRHEEAREIWQKASVAHPNHPLAWKAACEAQGIGPFYRGLEVFEVLPETATKVSDLKKITSAAEPKAYSEDQLWDRSVNFLLGMQHANGGFFDSDYDFGGTDSLKNVHVAVTSLVGLALIEAEPKLASPEQKARIQKALDRASAFVTKDSNLNLFDRDEILWAQAYRIRFLSSRIISSDESAKSDNSEGSLTNSLQRAVQQLEGLQLKTGGWYHEYANAFVSATALTALYDAKDAGAKVDSSKTDRGLQRLASQRYSNGAYPYATRRESGRNEGTEKDLAGAGGRIAICELARQRWGQVSDQDFALAVEKSMKYHELLAKALKYDNHTSTYAYGGFFFWYDMQARSESIALIADANKQQELAKQQRDLILGLPEVDGCFIDSHELGRCYGTAMALLSLKALE